WCAVAQPDTTLDTLLLPLVHTAHHARLEAGALTLGIRPEDIYEAPPAELRSTAGAMPVRVVAVEPLGAETLVVLRLASSNTEVIARVGRDSRFVAGETSTIFLDLARVHLFDPVTTAAITPSPRFSKLASSLRETALPHQGGGGVPAICREHPLAKAKSGRHAPNAIALRPTGSVA